MSLYISFWSWPMRLNAVVRYQCAWIVTNAPREDMKGRVEARQEGNRHAAGTASLWVLQRYGWHAFSDFSGTHGGNRKGYPWSRPPFPCAEPGLGKHTQRLCWRLVKSCQGWECFRTFADAPESWDRVLLSDWRGLSEIGCRAGSWGYWCYLFCWVDSLPSLRTSQLLWRRTVYSRSLGKFFTRHEALNRLIFRSWYWYGTLILWHYSLLVLVRTDGKARTELQIGCWIRGLWVC